jgi:hypothetical protein
MLCARSPNQTFEYTSKISTKIVTKSSHVVSLVEDIFQLFCHVIFQSANGSIQKLDPNLALDVTNHPNPGIQTNGNINGEVL